MQTKTPDLQNTESPKPKKMSAPSATASRVCSVLVTYHPTDFLNRSINALKEEAADVVIVDNTDSPDFAFPLSDTNRAPDLHLIRNGANLGIATALNIGIKHALALGYEWVATFDQDSLITPGYFKAMFEAYDACPFRERVALMAPLLCFSSEESSRQRGSRAGRLYSLTRTAMSSGSIIRSDVFTKEGFYDESFFMDYVDYEFCLRLWKRGWKVIRANQAHLLHRLGIPQIHSLFGLKITTKSHNAWRRYYIMRNRVTVFRRYGLSSPAWCLYDFFWIFLELAKITFFEKEKVAQFRATARGLWHGLTGANPVPK